MYDVLFQPIIRRSCKSNAYIVHRYIYRTSVSMALQWNSNQRINTYKTPYLVLRCRSKHVRFMSNRFILKYYTSSCCPLLSVCLPFTLHSCLFSPSNIKITINCLNCQGGHSDWCNSLYKNRIVHHLAQQTYSSIHNCMKISHLRHRNNLPSITERCINNQSLWNKNDDNFGKHSKPHAQFPPLFTVSSVVFTCKHLVTYFILFKLIRPKECTFKKRCKNYSLLAYHLFWQQLRFAQ